MFLIDLCPPSLSNNLQNTFDITNLHLGPPKRMYAEMRHCPWAGGGLGGGGWLDGFTKMCVHQNVCARKLDLFDFRRWGKILPKHMIFLRGWGCKTSSFNMFINQKKNVCLPKRNIFLFQRVERLFTKICPLEFKEKNRFYICQLWQWK